MIKTNEARFLLSWARMLWFLAGSMQSWTLGQQFQTMYIYLYSYLHISYIELCMLDLWKAHRCTPTSGIYTLTSPETHTHSFLHAGQRWDSETHFGQHNQARIPETTTQAEPPRQKAKPAPPIQPVRPRHQSPEPIHAALTFIEVANL